MRTWTISSEKIAAAREQGLVQDVNSVVAAAEWAQVPFAVALALVEQESHGRNVYGHDKGGTFEGLPFAVTRDNFRVFWWLVNTKGQKSNGVGPLQITYPGLLKQMINEGLSPWLPEQNIYFGLRLLKELKAKYNVNWVLAAGHYNGGNTPNMAYAAQFEAKLKTWRKLFKGL